jgi:2-(1,2-epoxy-1,2-dihydrophenyl)acetyl-CoA isomerase
MTITVEIENATATVTLNRPDKKNAVSMEMRTLLWEAFERIAEDDAIRAVVLTGAGTDFCSGMDVGEMGSGDGMTGSMMRMRRLHRIGRAIYSLKKPVIAAVSGICVGAGWSYALSADIVLASETARFAQIFRKIALAPDAGAVWLLSQQIGQMRAKEIVKTMAADFAAGPTLALAQAKRQFQLATTQSYDDFLEYEFSMQPLMTRSEDHHEGITAFKERRPPEFKGR